jgi:hypothetical protein
VRNFILIDKRVFVRWVLEDCFFSLDSEVVLKAVLSAAALARDFQEIETVAKMI